MSGSVLKVKRGAAAEWGAPLGEASWTWLQDAPEEKPHPGLQRCLWPAAGTGFQQRKRDQHWYVTLITVLGTLFGICCGCQLMCTSH